MKYSKIHLVNVFIILLSFFCTTVEGKKSETGIVKQNYILKTKAGNAFIITENGKTADIYVDKNDWKGVIRAAGDLGDDIGKVSGVPSNIIVKTQPNKGSIIAGTIGKSTIIDNYIKEKRLDVSEIVGKWESYIIHTIDGNLIIAGSDKR